MEPLRWSHAGNGCWNESKSVLLVVTSTSALVFASGGIEVILQRYADFSGILVGIASQNFYRIVALPFVTERAKDVVGKEYCR